jgi:hypothetical protein
MMFPKFVYTRSKPLLEACRALPCQHCGAQNGTVVAAHSNQAIHGKGKSVKSSDQFVASLCARCHSSLDQGYHLDKAQKVAMWNQSHAKTVAELVSRGLWPENVPIPDIRGKKND